RSGLRYVGEIPPGAGLGSDGTTGGGSNRATDGNRAPDDNRAPAGNRAPGVEPDGDPDGGGAARREAADPEAV
ncbi:MAG: hypothetical protein ACOCYG_02450, partial [Spirochaetota bacterium]